MRTIETTHIDAIDRIIGMDFSIAMHNDDDHTNAKLIAAVVQNLPIII